MQLFAYENLGELVSANQARKKQNYHCTECGRSVRLRGGIHRQNHFYHLKPDKFCRQSQKSLVHLQVQFYFQQHLPENECALERRFPEISRIADVVWESQKLIFEVQCSPITAEEVEARNYDYLRCGYQVVWILHDRRFNRWRVSAAELFLRDHPFYYTNINSKGRGFIYDQVDKVQKGRRHRLTGPLRIRVNAPLADGKLLYFSGDVTDRKIQKEERILEVLETKESRQIKRNFFQIFLSWMIRPYLLIFRLLLEKSCD